MQPTSTVYGPVRSWRVGASLGVDLLCVNSVCSFRCNYCQLGRINLHTLERRVYVQTARVISDLRYSAWPSADAITFSGSGEPTLAANLAEAVREVKALTAQPVVVLTNSSTLNQHEVRRDLLEADRVFCKLDAVDDHTFRLINRPVEGLTARGIIEGIKALRKEYGGHLAVQVMLQRVHRGQARQFAEALNEIGPDEVQLNLPTRPVPLRWFVEARGNNVESPVRAVPPKLLTRAEVALIESEIRELTGLTVTSAYSRLS